MQPQFVHLNIHTEYSIQDGIVRLDELIEACVSAKMPAVALSDRSNLFGMVKFYSAAFKSGIKPIIGVELEMENPKNLSAPHTLLLLCQNQEGYLNLTRLVSRAYLEGQTKQGARIHQAWLTPENVSGLIALSGGMSGDIGEALLSDQMALAEERLQQWQQLFPQRFYIELQRIGRENEERYVHLVLPLAERFHIPVVATNAVRFLNQDDYEAHEARVCIHEGAILADPKRARRYTAKQYLRTPEEMAQLFSDIPSALENTVEIAKRCNLILNLGQVYLPKFPTPQGVSIEAYFERCATEGLEKRLQLLTIDAKSDAAKPYWERLQIELPVIQKMGFAGYFLIVADFIAWAKKNGVPVGPGRGSGAGSLVAYSLEITDLDPIALDLLFERFLNPERVSMPDFDIDFCMQGRDRVIEYVAEKYGRSSVSQIITYGTMAAKAVVRDVGRVQGHPYGFVDKIAKLIPFELGITLDKALAQEVALRERYQNEEEVKNLIDLAKKLEGITRNAGKHAGGVVIAPSVITDFAPLYCELGSQDTVTQFDKDDVEAVGLVKFDFLGLRTLTIIDWALRTINQQRAQEQLAPIDIARITVEDKKTYELLKACQTTAVFQLESRGMKDLIRRLKPDCFDEIVALVALFRPGPLQSGMVDDFINRKHGREPIVYLHPQLEPILKSTYGVILYQEQVMQIAQVLAGYTLGGADLLRRAMGKKKPEEMAKQRSIFVDGAQKNGVSESIATEIFDLMEKFAGYGFNKSHSAAYALLSYQTAWLKAHYPAQYMAAVLSADIADTDKVVIMIDECAQMKIKVLPPSINVSEYKFVVNEKNEIVYGLGALKGAGENAIEHIVQIRKESGLFKSLFDFTSRMDLRKVNKKVLEALIYSGSMDDFQVSRASLLASLPSAVQFAEQRAKNKAQCQTDLFGDFVENDHSREMEYVAVPTWSDALRLQHEKETLGLYLTGHPLEKYRKELSKMGVTPLKNINPSGNQRIKVAGMILAIRTLINKRGDRMAFFTLDDKTARIEMAAFSDVFEKSREYLQKDNMIWVEGEVSVDEFSGGYRMSAKNIYSLEKAREMNVKKMVMHVNKESVDEPFIQRLRILLQGFVPGRCPIALKYENDAAHAEVSLGANWCVTPKDSLIDSLQALIGKEQLQIEY